ncbi:MAG TPA: response regulator transcription factor [Acidimicrobiales bacterium]|nr:response regulator transcription factor [Acidimicrobiales bacterium]
MAATSVVVVDRWPLVRMGIGRSLPSLSFRVLEEVDSLGKAKVVVRSRRPGLVVIGSRLDGDAAALVEVAKSVGAHVLALVDGAARPELAALATAGADGILTASCAGPELLDAARAVMAGGRALSPELVPALAGVIPLHGVGVRGDQTAGGAEGSVQLTERERQVLRCLVRGSRNEEIAGELFMSTATVKTHLNHIYAKLEVRGRHEATARAIQLGLVS